MNQELKSCCENAKTKVRGGGPVPVGEQGGCEPRIEVIVKMQNQRTNGPVNAHLISWPCKAQNIQNLENIW